MDWPERRVRMGMNAELLAIGRYAESIQKHMDYTGTKVPEGTPVLLTVHHCATTTSSQMLAEACGIGHDGWEFTKHRIGHKEMAEKLKANQADWKEIGGNDLVRKVRDLVKAKFSFWYRPNG